MATLKDYRKLLELGLQKPSPSRWHLVWLLPLVCLIAPLLLWVWMLGWSGPELESADRQKKSWL